MRRELAANFVHYTPDYDRFRCLPAWAKKTLAEHAADRRESLYDRLSIVVWFRKCPCSFI